MKPYYEGVKMRHMEAPLSLKGTVHTKIAIVIIYTVKKVAALHLSKI